MVAVEKMETQADDIPDLKQPIPSASYAVIEYPGYVRNSNRALHTLGGLDSVNAAVHGSSNAFLKLSFRPDEPTSHPIFGDKHACNHLLLRISRKRTPIGAAQQGQHPPKVEIVGTVTTAFQFAGLADFAYLPVDNSHLKRDYSKTPDSNNPKTAEPTEVVEPLLAIPPLFSKADVPLDYAFKQYPQISSGAGGPSEVLAAPQVSFYCTAVPQLLTAEQLAVEAPPGQRPASGLSHAAAKQLLERTSKALEDRPIWSPQMLAHHLATRVPEEVVGKVCYKFKTGPWRHLYVRRGYDPRADTGSRKYQAITYELPLDWYDRMAAAVVARSRASVAGTAPQPSPQVQSTAAPQPSTSHGTAATVPVQGGGGAGGQRVAGTNINMAALNKFAVLPTSRTTVLQLCDLKDEQIQALVDEAPLSERCSEANGWLQHSSMQRLLGMVSARFQVLIGQQQQQQQQQAPPLAAPASGELSGHVMTITSAVAAVTLSAPQPGTAGTVAAEDVVMADAFAAGTAAAALGPPAPPAGASSTAAAGALAPGTVAGSSEAIPGADSDSGGVEAVEDVEDAGGAQDNTEQSVAGLLGLPSNYLESLMQQMSMQGGAEVTAGQADPLEADEYQLLEEADEDDLEGEGEGDEGTGAGQGGLTTEDEGLTTEFDDDDGYGDNNDDDFTYL